jgi:hypothetical protein
MFDQKSEKHDALRAVPRIVCYAVYTILVEDTHRYQ